MQHATLRVAAFFAQIKLTMSTDLALIELQAELCQLTDALRTLGYNRAHHRSLQRPAPAASVSRTCSSNESSSLVTHAIPPCAHAVVVLVPVRFVITTTDPCFAAFNAKLRPAMPLPITAKS